jgi:hypothetical protein
MITPNSCDIRVMYIRPALLQLLVLCFEARRLRFRFTGSEKRQRLSLFYTPGSTVVIK